MKYLWRNKMALLLVILMLVFFQPTVSLPEQSKTENIVVAVGVDKMDEEYEVSIQYILPYKSSGENELKLGSIKAENVAEGMHKMNLLFGKNSGFAHCKMLILNDKVCEEDITSVIDFFSRIKTNSNNILLINTPTSAKDVLSTASDLNSDLYIAMNCKCLYGHRHYQNLKSLGDYYDSFFGPTKCITITIIDTEKQSAEDSSSGGGSSSGGSSGGDSSNPSSSSSTSPPEEEKKMKNEGKLAVIKNGRKILELSEEQSVDLNWFNPKVRDQFFTIKDFSDEYISNANLTFDIFEKKVKVKTHFEGNIPHYTLKLDLSVRANQLSSENISEIYYEVMTIQFSEKLKESLKQYVSNSLSAAEALFKQKEYDVIDCYSNFHKFQNKKFKTYLNSLDEDEYFLKNVVFHYEIEISQNL